MQQPGLRSAPLTKAALSTILTTSLLASLTSTKPFFHIQLSPHILTQHQFYRLAAFQSIFANAGELLFASLLLYHLRVIERIFGSRKFLSLLLYSYGSTSLLGPALLLVGWVATGGRWNYLPPGLTPVIFAMLAQYHAAVPSTYKFTVLLPGEAGEVSLSDKLYVYLLATQLAACQMPGSFLGAFVGWVVGYAWRLELVPGAKWRVRPGVVRMLGGEAGREYEGLRRRLRGQGEERGDDGRPIASRVLDTFRGGF